MSSAASGDMVRNCLLWLGVYWRYAVGCGNRAGILVRYGQLFASADVKSTLLRIGFAKKLQPGIKHSGSDSIVFRGGRDSD